MLVIGGGIIGLEMATVYSPSYPDRRGRNARWPDDRRRPAICQGLGEEERPALRKRDAQTKTVSAAATAAGIEVSFEGEKAPDRAQVYDLVLVAVGRSPNAGTSSGQAGVIVSDRGFIAVTSRCAQQSHIFAIGDIVGQPMLAHKAVHEAHVAAETAAGQRAYFDARQIPSVAYTDPEVAWAGLTIRDRTTARARETRPCRT